MPDGNHVHLAKKKADPCAPPVYMKRTLEEPTRDPNCLSIGDIPPEVWSKHILTRSRPSTLFVFRFVNKGAYLVVHKLYQWVDTILKNNEGLLTEAIRREMHDRYCHAQDLALFGSVTLYDWFTEIWHPEKIPWDWDYFMIAAENGHLDLVKHSREYMLSRIRPELMHTQFVEFPTMMGGCSGVMSCQRLKKMTKLGNLELIQIITPFFTNRTYTKFHNFVNHTMGTDYMKKILNFAVKSGKMGVIKFLLSPYMEKESKKVIKTIFVHATSVKLLKSILEMVGLNLSINCQLLWYAADNSNIKILKWALKKFNTASEHPDIHEVAHIGTYCKDVQKISRVFKFVARHFPFGVLPTNLYHEYMCYAISVWNPTALDWLITNGEMLTGVMEKVLREDALWKNLSFKILKPSYDESTKPLMVNVLYNHGLIDHRTAQQEITSALLNDRTVIKSTHLFGNLVKKGLIIISEELIKEIIALEERPLLRAIIENHEFLLVKEFIERWSPYAKVCDSTRCLRLFTKILANLNSS